MDKVHFIHIPKNAGMSIRKSPELKERITTSTKNNHISAEYSNNLHRTMKKYNEHHGDEHARWRDLKKSIRNGKCFAVVRNPWSKVVSRFTFLTLLFEQKNKRVVESPYYSLKSFEKFLEERNEWGNKEFFWHRAVKGWYPQLDHVADKNKKLRVDILRFEFLEQDLKKYFNMNIPFHQRNISNIKRIDYRTFYNVNTKKIIEDWYAEDIDFFGFTFDGSATKNIWNKK